MNEIALRLNKESSTPLYEQLYAFIKKEITGGNYTQNEKLPSKRLLSANLKCSQNTIQTAYNQLTAEGYLVSRAKSGYYVARLDGILSIDRAQRVLTDQKNEAEHYRYDFSHQGVDFDCFPFSVWRKITKEVINEYDLELLKTGEAQGYGVLRESIARYLHHSRGVTCTPEQVVISSGTEFLLQLLIQLFDEKYVYAIENPGYEKLNMIFKSNRVAYRPVPLDDSGMLPELLEKSMANVAIVTPSHQFPTGLIMPVARRIQLLNWANEKMHRYIIEDDYDSEFRYSGRPIPSLQGLDQGKQVIYLGAFSKSLSPALRVSYMVLPEQLLRLYREKLSFYICPVPTIEQKVLWQFMEQGHFERHLNRMRKLYKEKRETIVAAIRELLPEAQIEGATAGLHFALRVNNGMREQELIEAANRQKMKVYGFSRYYADQSVPDLGSLLLIGFATLKINDIADAISLLRKAWSQATHL